jgi:hypothetical protein
MFRSATRFAITLSLCIFSSIAARATDIDSALGYRAEIKDSWVYFDAKEVRRIGLHEESKKEIQELGNSVNHESISNELKKRAADDYEAIAINEQGDNISIRGVEVILPNNELEAVFAKNAMRRMLQEIMGAPITMNSTQLVKLPRSNQWALVTDFHIVMDGVRFHQVQYMVGRQPGQAAKIAVVGTFLSPDDQSHRSLMEEFMKSFQLK